MGPALKAEMSGSGRLENEFAPLLAGIGAVGPRVPETTGFAPTCASGAVGSGDNGSGTLSTAGAGAAVGSTCDLLCSRDFDG